MEKDRQTLERERELGQVAEPCACGRDYCTGWTFGGLIGHGVGRPVGILNRPVPGIGRNFGSPLGDG